MLFSEGSRSAHPNRDSECLLLNVAGKLLMFQRDEPGQQIQGKQNKAKPVSILEYSWKVLSPVNRKIIVHFQHKSPMCYGF